MPGARYISFSPAVARFPRRTRKGNPMVAALVNQLLAVGLSCSACSVAEPNPVPSKTPAIQASAPAVADSACRVLDVTLGTAGSITVGFPNRATCGSGLTLISGGAPSWSQMAIIRVRVLNRGSLPIQLPVRVLLAKSGVQIIGAGTPGNITAITPDSTIAGGVALWRTGGSGQLAPGDSTVVDTVKLRFAAPARHAKLTFGLDAATEDVARPVAPWPVQWPAGPPLLVTDPEDSVQIHRTVYQVVFADSATGVVVRAFLVRFAARVIGRLTQFAADSNSYIIEVPDPGRAWTAVDSLARAMMAFPGARLAGAMSYGNPFRIRSRAPVDSGVAPTRSAWLTNNRGTWPWRVIRAPLAWGCETGLETFFLHCGRAAS